MSAVRGPWAISSLLNTPETVLSHEPRYAVMTTPDPLRMKRLGDPRTPIDPTTRSMNPLDLVAQYLVRSCSGSLVPSEPAVVATPRYAKQRTQLTDPMASRQVSNQSIPPGD